MAKILNIYKNPDNKLDGFKYPQNINVIINGKFYKKAVFDENGVFITYDELVIKELNRYGYEVEQEEEAAPKKKESLPPAKNKKKGSK